MIFTKKQWYEVDLGVDSNIFEVGDIKYVEEKSRDLDGWPWRLTLELKVTHINYMTFLISGCIQATDLILVSILTFSRSGISNMLKKITWPWRLTLELKVTHMNCMTFLISGCIQATDLILVSILTFARSRISENLKSVTWPWWLTLKMKVKHIWVWLFVSLVVNIIQTRSLYRF